jgi:hypothetical protein
MLRIPFSGSAIETPRILAVTADSPRKPVSAQTGFDKDCYVNLWGGFQANLTDGRGYYLLLNMSF